MNKRIKKIRQNAGMTQREFADRIGVSRNTIAAYETDARVPIDAIIVSICREFNVNEDWLRTGMEICTQKSTLISNFQSTWLFF